MINISFWGSPYISARLLEVFLKSKRISVKFVVSQEDKPRSARGRELEATAVKKLALQYSIPVFTPKSLKKNSDDLFDDLCRFSVDINVVFAYGKLIPERFFSYPPHGTLNFHASLLPALRGASPIEHSLLQGHEKTGWAMQKMVEELDAGDIYYSHQVLIKWEDDFLTLADRLMYQLLSFSEDIIEKYVHGQLSPVVQKELEATHCGKLSGSEGKINWADDVFQIRNNARALSARGGIFCDFQGKKCKIFPDLSVSKKDILTTYNDATAAGMVSNITENLIWICCADKMSLPVSYIQLDGKKKLSAKDFVNGYRIGLTNEFN